MGRTLRARFRFAAVRLMLPIVHHPAYDAGFAPGHRFPMGKYTALMRALDGTGLLARCREHRPDYPDHALIAASHEAGYVAQVFDAAVPPAIERLIGFGVTRKVADRALLASAGTVLAAHLALENGIACNTAGGSHHARFAHGAGFCTLNDVAIAAEAVIRSGAAGRILVVDCDVHQGDGTAEMLGQRADIFTLSLHAERNYPARKERSHLDVGLADGTGDEAYHDALKRALDAVLARFMPDLVFYNAGVDVHRSDKLGRLSLSDQGIWLRDEIVIARFRALGIPVCGVIGGGYLDDVDTLGRRHAILFDVASRHT